MWLEDVKPCKAHIEATGQEVSGVLGFGEISFNAGCIIDEKGRKKYKRGHIAYIPVFEKGAATLQNMKVKNLVIKPCRIISFEYVEKTE